MVASLNVDPSDVLAHAARIESVRDAMNPGSLPVSFAPAGADTVSTMAANRISGHAAEAVNALWRTWTDLGKVAETLRASANNYQTRDDASAAMLSGGTGDSGPATGNVPVPAVTPVAVPVVYTSSPSSSPEELATAIRSGAGGSSPEGFAQHWSSHVTALDAAASDLGSVQASLGSNWSGTAHDGASHTINFTQADLTEHGSTVAKVSNWASTHAADYRTAVDPSGGIPHPATFAGWHDDLNTAVAADNQYPGVYTAAVVQAQQQLGQGYAQTGQAYGQYAIDPVTGEAIDPLTGEPVDPATGQPLGDNADSATDDPGQGQEMLSTGGQLLSGLLSGAVGAAGAALGAITQGAQQATQMAVQSVGQIAKGISQGAEPDTGDLGLGGDSGAGGGDFGGGGSGGGSGGGAETAPAAMMAPGVGTASAPPTPATPSVSAAGLRTPTSAGMGGGMPYMPMGGGGLGGMNPNNSNKPEASADGKKFVAPQRANTDKVIGESNSERISEKRQRRQQRMDDAKKTATEEQE